MAQIFSPPKKIEATMPSGRKTYRYAGDSDTLKKKIAGLKKSGASGVSVVAEEVTFKKGSPGEHLNKEKPLTPSKEKHHWASKGVYPKKADGSPLLKHRFFKQVSDPSKDYNKLIKKVTQKEEIVKAQPITGKPKSVNKNKEKYPGLQGEEAVNIYELSPETVKSFMQKRLKKSVDNNMAVDAADKGDKEGYKKHSGLQRKNFNGAMKAIRHAGNTLKRRTGMNEIAQQSIITHNIKSKDSNRPVVKKGTQLEGAFKRKLIDKMEKERLGSGSKPNVEKKKPSKAWSDIGYSNEKPKEMKEGKKPGLWDNIHAKRARIKAG